MKERIIVVPSSTDLAKTLAYHGKMLFNTRIFTPVELAQESLMRSGNLSDKFFISRNEELAYYFDIVGSVPYFKTKKLSDLKQVNSTINTIRQLVTHDEAKEIEEKLAIGRFKEKNDALFESYSKYITKLEEENKVDTIGLIRTAIENSYKFDCEISCIKEYPLQPLEMELIRTLSDGKCSELSLFDLFEVEENGIHINSYKNCYGSSNEVAAIIDDIYKDKKADQCVVACTDYSSYAQIFYDYACKYDIHICFGGGLSIINSYPGKLLQQYYHWSNEGNFGWQPFFNLIYSPYFDFELLSSYIVYEDEKEFKPQEFWKRVSRLRLTNNAETNKQIVANFRKSISRSDINDNDKLEKYVEGIEIVASELSLPIEKFLEKYSKTRSSNDFVIRFDNSASSSICNEIKMIKNVGLEITSDVVETILRKTTFRQSAEPGHLYICSIDKASSSLRDNLYICGLSAASYPGSPKENPLLLDCDFNDFGNNALTSQGKIKENGETLFSLVKLASALGNEINTSYPGLNVSELKNNNASSLIFELFKQENGADKELKDLNDAIIKIGYFEPELSITRKIGEAYNNSSVIENKPAESSNSTKTAIKLDKISPSGLNTFFNCRKQFFYDKILRIPQPDDYDPYEVIPANEQGTLAHSLMEYLPEHRMEKEEFKEFAGKVFDEYMNITVPLIKDKIPNIREQFVKMLENGWEMDDRHKRKVAFKEEDKDAIHDETGIKIHGYPDRVELTDDGKAVIIDFKTERDLRAHKKDDIDSCLQVIVYAYIVEKTMGLEIDHCEYRMLRYDASKGIITCKYDQEIKDQLAAKLQEYKQALETGDFEIEPFDKDEEKDRCKYCKYGSICGKVVIDKYDD